MYPFQVKVSNGSGTSSVFFPDIYQNPFNIGIGVNIQTGAATYSVQHTFDYSTVMAPTWNGTSAVWFDNSGISATSNVTTNGNYAFAVAAIRLNVTAANATSVVVANFLQSSNAP